jgi:intergrase/recombinase
LSALDRFFDKYTIKSIKDLRRAIEAENYNEKIVKGLRNFINFLVDELIIDEGTAALLKRPLKFKRSTPRQVFITETELRKAYSILTEKFGEEAEILLKLLVFTGLRLRHLIKMLNNYDPQNLVVVNEKVARYPMIAYSKGTKKAFWAYMPADFAKELKRMDITYYMAQTRINYKRVSSSTIRKWFSNFMAQNKVPMEVIDFIQGRSPRSVLERHYLNMTVLADEAYSGVVDELKKVLEK